MRFVLLADTHNLHAHVSVPSGDFLIHAGDHHHDGRPGRRGCVRSLVRRLDAPAQDRHRRPWQPWFFDWAFNLERGSEIRAKWDLIPEGIDVLITHGPPAGHGDLTARGERVGCADLLNAVRRCRPRLHVFGHIHEGYGQTREGDTSYVNASICDVSYAPVQAPIVVDWP